MVVHLLLCHMQSDLILHEPESLGIVLNEYTDILTLHFAAHTNLVGTIGVLSETGNFTDE